MKAILVVDIPEINLPSNTYYVDTIRFTDGIGGQILHGKFAIKPLPEKKSIELACQKEEEGNDYGAGLIVGWNDCLEEITK